MSARGHNPDAARRLSMPADLFQEPRVVEASTSAFDPDRQGVGSSSYVGDAGNSVLFIPQTATTADTRYLFRLCGIAVPAHGKAKIIGVRQYATIAQAIAVSARDDSWSSILERPIETPTWSFTDGNIAWHLRVQRGAEGKNTIFPVGFVPQPNWSLNSYSTESGLMPSTLHGLDPASGNSPPGEPVGSLGTFRDIRFPWIGNAHSDAFGFEVVGPAIISLWASVRQTDPSTRAFLPSASAPTDKTGLTPEDRFLLSFGDPPGNLVRYRHIGGSVVANVGPFDMPWAGIDAACEGQPRVTIPRLQEIR